MTRFRVSVIIVNYNGGTLLKQCLHSLREQTIQDFEVIVVDNGSQDGSMEAIERGGEKLKVIELGKNTGFAAANNVGAKEAEGEWLVLLNNDVFPKKDWLENLLKATKKYPEYSFFGSHQYSARDPSILDGTGDMYAPTGLAWRRDFQKPAHRGVQQDDEVFSACAAAAMYRKDCFDEVGGFDEDYFCHFEDVDLSFRLRIAGYRCMHVANAVVHHVGSATAGGEESDFAIYQGYRNLVWTFVKCMPIGMMFRNLPAHLWLNVQQIRAFMQQGKRRAILTAKWHALIGLPRTLAKRRKIQRRSRATSDELAKWMTRRAI